MTFASALTQPDATQCAVSEGKSCTENTRYILGPLVGVAVITVKTLKGAALGVLTVDYSGLGVEVVVATAKRNLYRRAKPCDDAMVRSD
jgi:hypothetical protein